MPSFSFAIELTRKCSESASFSSRRLRHSPSSWSASFLSRLI